MCHERVGAEMASRATRLDEPHRAAIVMIVRADTTCNSSRGGSAMCSLSSPAGMARQIVLKCSANFAVCTSCGM